MNCKSFVVGFIAGAAFLSGISYWNTRPKDVTVSWSDDGKRKSMKALAPWLTKAKGGHIGPLAVFVPSDLSLETKAIMYPIKGGYPMIMLGFNILPTPEITIIDAKNRALSITYNSSTGEFASYEFSPKLASEVSYFDYDLNGEYDTKITTGKGIDVLYDSKWIPVVSRDKKKYIETNGVVREIKIGPNGWAFAKE